MFNELTEKRLDSALFVFIIQIIFYYILLLSPQYNCCIVIGIDQLEKTLCKTKACPNYSRCKIDENGYYAKCYCPFDCDINDVNSMIQMFATPFNYTNSLASFKTDQQVCGTNGKDYKNFCALQKESCDENNEIKIAYLGKCGKYKIELF
jgi:hypothetical protein